jgi:hypothetical protein
MHYFIFPLSASSVYIITTNGLIMCLDLRGRHVSAVTMWNIRSVKGHLTQRFWAASYLQTVKQQFISR